MTRPPERWTPLDRRVVALYQDGLTLEQVAQVAYERGPVTRERIRLILIRCGVPRRR